MSHTIFEYPITILENRLDTFGHVNNAEYLRIFEEARWELINAQDYGIKKIRETGLGPTILEIKLRFLKEIRLREKVVIKTQLLSYEGKVSILKQWIENSKGETACESEFKIGLFDVKLRKLVEPTAEWLKALGEA
jgi:acyl-CoA thioester hydrolase